MNNIIYKESCVYTISVDRTTNTPQSIDIVIYTQKEDNALISIHFNNLPLYPMQKWIDECSKQNIEISIEPHPNTSMVAKQLKEYFMHKRSHYDCPVLFLWGTELQKKVWHHLLTIPVGQTQSYYEVACAVKYSKAVRAVATAIANNPIPIVGPCHRVIRKDRSIGQYQGGTKTKKALLDLENNI